MSQAYPPWRRDCPACRRPMRDTDELVKRRTPYGMGAFRGWHETWVHKKCPPALSPALEAARVERMKRKRC